MQLVPIWWIPTQQALSRAWISEAQNEIFGAETLLHFGWRRVRCPKLTQARSGQPCRPQCEEVLDRLGHQWSAPIWKAQGSRVQAPTGGHWPV